MRSNLFCKMNAEAPSTRYPDVNRSFPFGTLSVNNRSWTIDASLRLLMREVDVGGV